MNEPFGLPSEADYGMTDMAMRGQEARYGGDDKLMVSFDVVPVVSDAKSAEEGRPICEDVVHIRIMVPGNKESIVIRPITDMDKARFAKQYENWKEKGAVELNGTPLQMCTWVTPGQVEEMKFFNVRTVEQLANIADVHAQKFMGINQLRKQARIYLKQAEKNAGATKLAKELEERDNQIAAQGQAIDELKSLVAGLRMQLQEQNAAAVPPPPKPTPAKK